MTREVWLEGHPYLRPLADLATQVERAAEGIDVLDVRLPDWTITTPTFSPGCRC